MIMIPLFMTVVFAILEASLWVFSSTVAQAAAQDAVNAGTASGARVGAAQDMARDILLARDVGGDWVVTVDSTDRAMTVTVTGHAPSALPGVHIQVRESATLPWEGR